MSDNKHTPEPMFQFDFNQLATFENGRTPILLTEDQYRRAKACVNACAGMSNEQVSHGLVSASVHSALAQQRDELLAAIKSISKITGDAGFNIGGPLEHCPGEIDHDEAKRLLSLACEYLKDTSKAAHRAIASVKSEESATCEKCNTPDLCREYGRACDPYDLPETSVPAIVFYPAGSLSEPIEEPIVPCDDASTGHIMARIIHANPAEI